VVQEFAEFGFADPSGWPSTVQAGPPERLVSVDIADAGDDRLIKECSLDLGVLGARAGNEHLVVKEWIEWIAGDMRRDAWDTTRRIVRNEFVNGEPAEGSLVDEAQLRNPIAECDPNAQVRSGVSDSVKQ